MVRNVLITHEMSLFFQRWAQYKRQQQQREQQERIEPESPHNHRPPAGLDGSLSPLSARRDQIKEEDHSPPKKPQVG
jgi:hypothetical protein